MALNGKRILLGVTGGIAAYKAAELARRLIGCGAGVKVVMTRSAQEFVGTMTFAALTGKKVGTGLSGAETNPLEHIALGQEVDAIVVAPATANFIGKVARGIGDDLLTTIMLAATRPVLLCPAMNAEMWANPVVQGNLARLKGRGLMVMEPAAGSLACGAVGLGRLPEADLIVEACARLFCVPDLAGRRVLVTAGPTHEDFDPVRFLTNRSSGKQGYASGEGGLAPGRGRHPGERPHQPAGALRGEVRVAVRSALDMQAMVKAHFPEVDALLMAAAVSDYRPTQVEIRKIKRGAQEEMHFPSYPEPRHPETGGFARKPGRSWWGSRPRPTIWRPRPAARCGKNTWTSLWPTTSTGRIPGSRWTPTKSPSSPRVGEPRCPCRC